MQTPSQSNANSFSIASHDGARVDNAESVAKKRLGKSPSSTGRLENNQRIDTAHRTPVPAPISLDRLHLELHRLLVIRPTGDQITTSLVQTAASLSNAMWSGYFGIDPANGLVCLAQHNAIADRNLGLHQTSLLPTVQLCHESCTVKVSLQGDLTVIAVPVLDVESEAITCVGCFCVALNLGRATAEPFVLMLQLIAATMGQFRQTKKQPANEWQVESTAAIVDLMSQIALSHDRKSAAIVATNRLAGFLNASVVAIGFCSRRGRTNNQVMSISGSAKIDAGGKQAKLLQTAMDESLVRGGFTSLPAIEADDRAMKLAHQQLLESHPNHRLVSSPLVTSDGETLGAWVCLLPDDVQNQARTVRFVNAVSNLLADAMYANREAAAGVCQRATRSVVRFFDGKVGRRAAAALAAILLILCIPMPHRVACNCQLQPTERRFAVAPFQGILLESFVQPGDLVSAGQSIAKMDDRELVLQLADLTAQRETVRKKRDVSRSARDAAATKIAELEIEQLNAQIALARYKQDRLTIRAPVDGVVLQGKLENAQGAPVRTGDVLVEVSPLATLKLELNVAECDLSFVAPKQPVTFSLEGTPFQQLQGSIDRIRPESEIRNNRNVFVSELAVDNEDQKFRPGMQGYAKVAAGNRPLGWLLFHRPAQRVYSIFR